MLQTRLISSQARRKIKLFHEDDWAADGLVLLITATSEVGNRLGIKGRSATASGEETLQEVYHAKKNRITRSTSDLFVHKYTGIFHPIYCRKSSAK